MNDRNFFAGLIVILIGGNLLTIAYFELLGLIVAFIGGALSIKGLMDRKSFEDYKKDLKDEVKEHRTNGETE